MAIKKSILFLALIITVVLLTTIILINKTLDKEREEIIESQFGDIVAGFNEMQSLMLMGDIYGDKMSCIIFDDRLKELDKSIWKLGQKIDQYRRVSEEFFKSPYYLQQKKIFNEKEVFYLHLLKGAKQKCNLTQPTILFFYRNSEDCTKCDDQSFVLSDINDDIDEEVSIFSFDMDLNLTTLKLLKNFYEIDEYPCVVIEDKTYCGMKDKDTIIQRLCEENNLSVCE